MSQKKFLGVFSAQSKDVRGNPQKQFFFAWRLSAEYEVQRLDSTFSAKGAPRTINTSAFETLFVYEPTVLAVPLTEKSQAQPAPESPEAVKPGPDEVEATLRTHFYKALRRLKNTREKDVARSAIQTLIEVDEGIEDSHKHLFAEFGVNLRKNKELDAALAFCKRVLALAPQDDHAYFNVSRVLLEMGQWDEAEQHLRAAITMAPDTNLYHKMLRYLQSERQKHKRPSPQNKGGRR